MPEFQPGQEREPLSALSGSSVANQSMAASPSVSNSSLGGTQATLSAPLDREAAPVSGSAPPAPSAASGKPKWAALLKPGGPGTEDAPGPAVAAFPGLGKTQAGNILASLANQPISSPASPAAAAARASTAPSSRGLASRDLASRELASRDLASRGLVATPAQGARPSPPPAPAQTPPGQSDPQQAPVAGVAGVTRADGLPADNGTASPDSPDSANDDILPSKPRASLRFRPRFRLR
jgi:hypothetical protein